MGMRSHRARPGILWVGLFGVLILVGMGARDLTFQGYSPWEPGFYLTDQQIAFVRPGLVLEIRDIRLVDRQLSVEFSIADDRGLPLDIDGVSTPGPVSVRFLIAYLPPGETQYVNYRTREVTSSITGITANQPTSDSGGSFEEIEEGVYVYTYGLLLPEGFDESATHTVGVYATRDLREFDMDRFVANEVSHFVPSGADVEQIRQVVVTDNCNECHNPISAHGGSRRKTELCILCHTPQNVDPDTGNSVDFKVMIHKIHRGEHLPSVEAGTPYQIIGFRGSIHDFSEIAFPQDIRNCQKCHKDAAQGDNYYLNPNRAACGSCHDLTVFATGLNHAGGPQISDRFCAACHFPQGELEFDASVLGAHTVPYKSNQLKGLNIALLDVSDTGPGSNPTVMFAVTEDDGTAVDPADLAFFNLNIAGPTEDYSTLIRESARAGAVPAGAIQLQDGSAPLQGYLYTFQEPIPADATGSFAVGAEGYRMVKLNEGMVNEMDFRETAENPVLYFGVTDPVPVPRRTVVVDAKCERCHDNLALHGTIRHDPEYCVMCHIPSGTDIDRRPEDELPPQTRHFKFMIHRIHRGEDLTREFTIYGFGGSKHTFNELHFPGDLRDCETCHVNDSYEIPLPEGVLPTFAPREFFSPLTPIASACLACHDEQGAAAHAFTMIAPFGEACAACHGEGAEFAIERVHARNQ